ncbi:MAG TPA: lipopolysaccharide biosynthesis protein, partial [Smithellaceae bacterium]|nr:lipopolysaccharide biosynthesis protein [Smithellaceae bacterium]
MSTSDTTPRNSLREQSAYLFVGQTVSYIIHFITPVFLVRLISRDEYGVYLQFLLITQTLIPILNLTLPSSLLFLMPTATAEEKRGYVWQTAVLLFSIGVIFAVVFVLFANSFLSFTGFSTLKRFSFMLVTYLVFMLISEIGEFIFVIEKKKIFNLIYYPLDRLVKLVILVTLVLLTRGFRGCIYALWLYSVIRLGFIIVYLYCGYFSRLSIRWNKKRIIYQLNYALPFAAGIMIKTIAERMDKYIVNLHVSPGQYAIYGIAFMSIPLLHQLYTAVNNVAMPEITILAAAKNRERLHELWHKIVEKNASVTIPCVVFFVIMTRELIGVIFTDRYIEAVPYYRIYLITFLFVMTSYGMILRGANKTRQIFRANFIGSLLTLLFGLLLIRRFLLWGAMVTAVCGISLPIVLQLAYEKRYLKLDLAHWFPWGKLLRILLSCIPSVLLLFAIRAFVRGSFLRLAAGAA